MSAVRGGGARGRGRGSLHSGPATPRGSGTRGRGQRSAPSPPQSSAHASLRAAPAQRSAVGVATARGSWQDRFQKLTRARERERTDAIRQGLIADPDKPRSLSEAITPLGTCQDMCAEYERVQRVVQKDVWDEETATHHSPFATTEKEPDEARMVKKFRRAAAGLEEQLPSDLRPPHVLKSTCDYLFDQVIGNASSLAHVHHFVWDRTRAIRNDFSIQQVTKPEELRVAIDCYERIARFHILSLHQLALPEKPYSKYDWQQEREQLDRTLLSLMQYYEDSNGRIDLQNEAEFRAYCVVFQLQDPTPDLEDRVQTWPKRIIQDTRVQTATELYMAAANVMDSQGPLKPRANHLIARQDWQRFWTLVASKEVSYLMACVAEIYFDLVRRMVLNALFRTFRMNSSLATPDWTIDTLCELFAFDTGDEVYTYCERFGFSFKEREDGQQYLDLTSVRGRTLPEPSAGITKQSKSTLVEDKRFGRTLPAVINGFGVKRAHDSGLVLEDEGSEESMQDLAPYDTFGGDLADDVANADDGEDDENSLFVPATKTTPSVFQTPGSTPLVNGKDDGRSTLFSRGFSGASTFGRASNVNNQPSELWPATDSDRPNEHRSITSATNSIPKPDTLKSADTKIGNVSVSPFDSFRAGGTAARTSDEPSIGSLASFGQPSNGQSSIFDEPVSKQRTSLFSIGATAGGLFSNTGPNSNSIAASGESSTRHSPLDPSTLQSECKSSWPEQPKDSSVFGQHTGVPAPKPAAAQPSETKASQHHFTSPSAAPISPAPTPNPHAPSPSGVSIGVKRVSFSADTKPKKPSPLSASITAGDTFTSEAQKPPPRQEQADQPLQPPPEQAAAEEFEALVTRLADELVHNPHDGYLKQYIEFFVHKTITAVQDQIATEKNHQEADAYREFKLCEKYGTRWRDIFWQRRLARAGRERRERRHRRLQRRGSQSLENGSLYDDHSMHDNSRAGSAAGGMSPRNLANMRDWTPNPRADQPIFAPSPPNHVQAVAGSKRPMSSHSVDAPIPSRELGHKRMKSTSHVDGQGRITKPTSANQHGADILQRSSFLGFSLAQGVEGSNTNTTKSNYFRLKAMGVNRADHSSGLRGTKRLYSESIPHSMQTSPPALRPSSRIEAPSQRSSEQAQLGPSSPAAPLSSQSNDDEDEALFARLRAAREGLKQGVSLFNAEAANRAEFRESQSSLSSLASPSMMQARAHARSLASQAASEADRSHDRRIPAYRLRESKFVPREHYSKAIARAKEIRASRSREPSRPESPAEGVGVDHKSSRGIRALPRKQAEWATGITSPPAEANGLSYSSAVSNHVSGFEPISQPLTFQPQPQGPAPLIFTNHTTHTSTENPFLHSQVPEPTVDAVNSYPFHFDHDLQDMQGPGDHTIKPSQIPQSLANSFGNSFGSGLDTEIASQRSPTAPQQDSYLDAQAMSFLSDEDESGAYAGNPLDFSNQIDERQEFVEEELLDDATEVDDEDFGPSYLHANSHGTQRQHCRNEKAGSQDWYSEVESEGDIGEEGDADGYYGGSIGAEGFRQVTGEDEGASDGDIDEYENDSISVEEGYDRFDDHDDGEEDEDDGEEEEEEEEEEGEGEDEDGQHLGSINGQWKPAEPEANSVLQGVGNTAEEAIELSD